MMHLLAKTAERREAKEQQQEQQQQRHDERRDSTASSASDGDHSATATDDEPTPTAAGTGASGWPTAHRLVSLSGGRGREDESLFRSPLSLVSSLSHTLLHTAKHSLSEGGHAGHKLLRQVRAGVRAGISGIEAAAMRNDHEHEQGDRDHEHEHEHGAAEREEKYPLASNAVRGRNNQRHSTADGAVAEEDADAAGGSDEESDDGGGADADAADAPLSAADLAVRRINFMRLLSRGEDMSYRHLHAAPGERPLLLVRAGEPNPDAAAFFRFVALLQRELAEHFSADSAGGGAGSRGRKADAARTARMLHADPRKDLELRRRVAFLATVSDKEESAAAAAGALGYAAGASAGASTALAPWSEEKKHAFASGAAPRPRHTYTPANPARERGAANAIAGTSTSAIAGPAWSHSDALRPPPLAHGVHSLRSSSVAAIASAASAAAAAAAAAPGAASPALDHSFSSDLASPFALDDAASAFADDAAAADADDDSVAELLERAPPPLDPTQELRAMLFAKSSLSGAGGGSSGGGAGSSSSSGSGGGGSGSVTQSAEFRAEMEQRALVNELHSMTESLKANALRLRSAMGADARVLDAADSALDSNLAAIRTENARLKKWAHSGCSEMCWNILLIVVLWAVFIATFLFIKIFPAPKN